jgi:hypothetical protein
MMTFDGRKTDRLDRRRDRRQSRRQRSGLFFYVVGSPEVLELRSCPAGTSGLAAAAIVLPVDPNVSEVRDLQGSGASDLFEVTIDTDGQFTAQVQMANFASRISLLDDQGQLLIQSEASSPENTGGRVAMHLDPGTYFVMVQDLTASGSYTLQTSFTDTTQPAQPLTGNSGAYSVAVADLTASKNPDLIVADLYVDQVLIYLGAGDGTFQPPIALPVGSDPVYVTTADLTGTGIQDIITSNLGSNDLSVLMGNGDGTFQPAIEVPAGPGPSSVAVGNFDGDGHPDLAVTDSYSDTVQILLGEGNGTFEHGQTITTNAAPWSVAAADFNGNGRTDLAIVSIGSTDLTILDGNGDGTFTQVQQLPTPIQCLSVVAADFNGDGRPDLAVASAGNDTVEIFMNDNGVFVAGSTIRTPSDPFALVAADFNDDGKVDLAVTSYRLGGVTVLLGNGDGTFVTDPPISVGPSTTGIAAADLTSDGRVDIVSANLIDQTIDVSIGNGDGTFQAPTQPSASTSPPAIVAADLTNNGIKDLIIPYESTNEVAIVLGRGDGSFQAPILVPTGKGPSAVAVGDFNDDGIPDIAVTNEIDDSVTILLGVGNGTFIKGNTLSTQIQPSSITAADLTGDGELDLVVSNFYSSSISIFYGEGNGNFQNQVVLPVGNLPSNPVVADFNGDGLPDIAVADSRSEVTVFLATGLRSYAPALRFHAGPGADALAAGNLTGDGKIDLVVADSSSSGSSYIMVLLGNGDGTFTTGQTLSVAGDPTSLALADMTGDGKLDIIAGNGGDTDLSLFVGLGNGTFEPAISVPSGSTPSAFAVADFNGDGRPDIASADSLSGQISVMFATGAGTFDPPAQFSDTPPVAIVSADFNADGRLDLAMANPLNNTVTILMGNGDGTFTTGETLSVGLDPAGVVVGDFNGDGRPDLAVADAGSDNVEVFFGLGDGTFSSPIIIPVGKAPTSIVAGDFTGKGITDIAVADEISNNVAVILGNGHGTFMPPVYYAVGAEPVALVAADLAGNGQIDLVTANRSAGDLTILWAMTSGTFTTETLAYGGRAPTALAVGDFNGDGTIDLAVADEDNDLIAVLLNEGNRTFAPPLNFSADGDTDFLQAIPRPAPQTGEVLAAAADDSQDVFILFLNLDGSLESRVPLLLEEQPDGTPIIGDFNGDAYPDVAFPVASSAQVIVELGSGAEGIGIAPQDPAPLPQAAPVVVDWNSDGIPDVVDLNEQGQLLLRLGQPGSPGEFESPEVIGGGLGVDFAYMTLVSSRNGPVLAAIESGEPVIWLFSPGPGGAIESRSITVAGAGFLVSITAGDLVNDGLEDLVLVDRGNDQLILLYQSVSGSFTQASTPLAVGYAPSVVAVADLNQSGWPDLVVSNTYSGDLSVFYGGPGRTFSSEVLLAAGLGASVVIPQDGVPVPHSGDEPIGVTTGVFDSSGLTDIVSLQSGSDRISLLEGTPDGEIADPSVATSYTTGVDPTQVVAASLTNDGLTDLIVLNQGSQTISIFLNNGHGGFISEPPVDAGNDPTGVAVRDDNGDGISDLLVSNKQGDLLIILGNGNGTFMPYARADQTVSLAVGDFGSNGQPEYVLSNTSIDQLSILYGESPSFVQGRSQGLQAPGAVAVVDLNGDGNPDIIVVNTGDNDILIYMGLGGNRFEAPLVYSTGTDPEGITVADVNENGNPDLIVANAGSNDLSIFMGVGQGANWELETGPRLRVGDQPVSTTVADVNGDGIPDIICVDQGSDNVVVLRGLGRGFFADNDPTTLPTGLSPILAFAGKFDSSPGLDLAVIDSRSNDLTYYSNLPNPTPTPVLIAIPGVDPIAAVMGDYTGDGYDDLVIADNGDSLINLFEGGPHGLVLADSADLDQPVRPTGLVIGAAAPGQLHLALSAEGDDQVISFTLWLTLGVPGQGQIGVSTSTSAVSSPNGAAAGSTSTADARFAFELLLANPESGEQAIVQTATTTSGASAASSGVAVALATVASTLQPIFNPSLGSLPGIISSLVQMSQVEISEIMPLENSALEAVAVLLVVSSGSMEDTGHLSVDFPDNSLVDDPNGMLESPVTPRNGSGLEQFLADLDTALALVGPQILQGEGKPTTDGLDRSLPLAIPGIFTTPTSAGFGPGQSGTGPIEPLPRTASGQDARTQGKLLNPTEPDAEAAIPVVPEAASTAISWITPLYATVIISSIVIGWRGGRKRWLSHRAQPTVCPSPGYYGVHSAARLKESRHFRSRPSRTQDLPPWLAAPK